MKYLKNIYVVLGVVGIGYYLYKRKQIVKKTPKAKKSVVELEDNVSEEEIKRIAKENKVPMDLVKDVQSMSQKEIAKTILANQKSLNEEDMSNDERNHLKRMIEFLDKQLK
jgi:methanogenic corrinoid protein MtbC1